MMESFGSGDSIDKLRFAISLIGAPSYRLSWPSLMIDLETCSQHSPSEWAWMRFMSSIVLLAHLSRCASASGAGCLQTAATKLDRRVTEYKSLRPTLNPSTKHRPNPQPA